MRLGMFMHPIHDFKRGYHTLLFEDLDVIRAADHEGFDEVWLGEHYLLPSEPFASPLMLYARLIAECPRITFGSGVLCLPNKHPALVAGEVAQFDHLAKGRFMLGIGPGAAPPDFELFGVLDKNRMEMLEESIDMMIRLWTEDPPYEIRGKYWQAVVKDNVLPRPRRRQDDGALPAAASADHAALDEPQLGEFAVGGASRLAHDLGQFRAEGGGGGALARLLRRAAEARIVAGAGKMARWAHPAGDRDRRGGARLSAHARQQPRVVFSLHHRPDAPRRLRAHAEIAPRHAGCGSDAAVLYRHDGHRRQSANAWRKRLAAFREEVGPFETLITSHHDWVPLGMWRRHMHLLAHEVMPILRSLTGVRHIPREDLAKTS